MYLLEELVNIDNRTWKYKDINYWINPKDNTCNATILFNGKSSRLRAGIIILKDDEILLGEEADEPGVFSLPGGGLEEGETPLEAAVREAQEEVYINVKDAVDTKFDYCECHDEVKDWVRDNVPDEEWWYNYYTCLIIAKYDGKYEGKVDKVDQDKEMKNSAKWYKIDEVINDPSFKEQWKKAIETYAAYSLDEAIDYHRYTYNGPVYLFNRYVGDASLETRAISLPKAINNLIFQAADKFGYDRSKGASFRIKKELVVDEDEDNFEEPKFEPIAIDNRKRCPNCGTHLNDAGECPVCDLGDEDMLYENLLLEDTRAQLANASKNAGEYKHKERGKNRWERKKYSKISTYVKNYNQIDMNEFFKQDILQIKIPVQGETDEYTVTIKLEGIVEEIARHIKSHDNKFEFKTVLQSITKIFNTKNVYVKCTCDDFNYRFKHWSIINNYGVDDTAHDPGPGKGIANPADNKGKGCKHILLCIANGDWIMKVTSVIMNYCNYAAENKKQAFMKAIFPKLYGIPATDAIDDGLVPEDTDLETDTNIIDTINEWAKNRGKFKKGSNKNPVTNTGGRKKKEEEPEEENEEKDNQSEEETEKSED